MVEPKNTMYTDYTQKFLLPGYIGYATEFLQGYMYFNLDSYTPRSVRPIRNECIKCV